MRPGGTPGYGRYRLELMPAVPYIEALETNARCVFSDIVKYYEKKRNEEKNKSDIPAHLTKESV